MWIGRSCCSRPSTSGAEARCGIVVVVGDRLVAEVATGHHQRARRTRHQHVVQRAVRQQQSELREPRSDSRRNGRARPARCQHDRSPARRQCRRCAVVEDAELLRDGQRRDHHRKRLVVARLSPSQFGDRRIVGRIGHQVVPTDPFHGDDRSGSDCRKRGVERIRAVHIVGVGARLPGQLRAAHRARVGLGVKAAVGGVVVLGLTSRAHRKASHRRGGPVVRNTQHDRVARTAVGAVGEGVAMPAIAWVVDLREAVVADGRVDADRHVGRPGIVALDDAEPGISTGWLQNLGDDPGNARQRRRIIDQPARQLGDPLGRAFDLDQHAGAVVQHVAGQAECNCMPVHERPEPDALHGAGDPHPLPGRGAGWHGLSRFLAADRRRACRRSWCRRSL